MPGRVRASGHAQIDSGAFQLSSDNAGRAKGEAAFPGFDYLAQASWVR
ncbi:MAG: hypothetical protein JWL98_983 [Xanthomonadaceae bacterium]|nr:hypothetical protein [Xanthomonadaceae bacterium]